METRPEYTVAGVDLADLDVRAAAGQGFELELLHPVSRAPLGMHITVLGTDSDAYQARLRELTLRRMELAARKKPDPAALAAQAEEDGLELLASITRGWRGLRQNGAELPWSDRAARDLYRRYPWIREQVEEAMRDRANFLPPSAPA